jgi:hypothetical protein
MFLSIKLFINAIFSCVTVRIFFCVYLFLFCMTEVTVNSLQSILKFKDDTFHTII